MIKKRLLFGFIIVGTVILLSYGCFNKSESGSSGNVPAAPSDLTAKALSDDEVILSWDDNSSCEDGIIIQRSKSTRSKYTLFDKLYGRNITEYDDTTVESHTTYYYIVSAFNDKGWSLSSNEVCVKTPRFNIFGGSSGSDNNIYCGCLGLEPFILILLIGILKRRISLKRKNPATRYIMNYPAASCEVSNKKNIIPALDGRGQRGG